MALLAELKRRNVLRAGVLYAGTIWALAQGIAQLGPPLGAPDWITRWFVIAAAIGFPFWIAFAWFYEFTPQGLKRESEIAADASIMRGAGRKLDRAIIAVLTLAVVLLLTNTFVWRRGVGLASDSALVNIPAKSIAVLPFENLSGDKNNGYFADGMQDMVLTKLADIGDLKVVSRTSTMQYQSHPEDLKAIARQLGVASILEGSVQKAGNQVLINVQLIDVRSDTHLWADSYQRTLDNIFGVEGDVAQKVADALHATLTQGERTSLAIKPTENAAAYDAWLRGLDAWNQPATPTNLSAAALYFETATKLDPAFALAWAHLSSAASSLYFFGVDHTPARLTQSRLAADRAMKLAPNLGASHLAEGYYLYYGMSDYDGALASFNEARRLSPNNTEVLAAISYVERRQGRFDAAQAQMQQAVQLDPRNADLLTQWASTYVQLRQFVLARAALDRVLALNPKDTDTLALKIQTWQAEGNLDVAGKLLAELPKHASGLPMQVRLAQWMYQRRYAPVIAALKAELNHSDSDFGEGAGDDFALLALAQRHAGDADGAHATLLRGRDALLALRKSGDDSDEVAGELGLIEAGLGDADAARREGQRALGLAKGSTAHEAEIREYLASTEATLGDADGAMPLLHELLHTPYYFPLTVGALRLDPVWDPIRTDSRFQALLKAGNGTSNVAESGGG